MKRTATLSLSLILTCVLFAGCSSAASPSGLSLPYRRHTRSIETPITFEGRVVGVQDGDTIIVLDSSYANHRIRLLGIDAPEKGQAFGKRSGENLSQAIFNRVVTIGWSKHDRYGRIIGKVVLEGQDVCLGQIKAGMAWHYKYYQDDQAREDRKLYAAAEIAARATNVGLWIDSNPVPPWDFRRQR
jgi:endonuclease YncB( thermonuclease family)